MSTIESQIKSIISNHTEAAVREVQAAYASMFSSAAPAISTPLPAPASRVSRRPVAKKPTPAVPKLKAKKPAKATPASGQKRDPKALVELQGKLLAYVKANPGQRIEDIGKAVGFTTKEMRLPMKKLIAGKQVKATGEKRATTYA